MVEILVHVRPADSAKGHHFELLECAVTSTILEVKQQICNRGKESGVFDLPADKQELVFLEERLEDDKCLFDYGVNRDFIIQVTGFVVNPAKPGKRFESGKLVPC